MATKTVLVCTGVAFALSVWYFKKTPSSLSSPALKQKSPKLVNKENTITKAPPHNASVSAPGKVLVAGGYTVLEQPNVGLVLASTARFHTDINSLPISQSMVKSFVSPIKRRNSTLSPTKSIPSSTPNSIPIQLNSPQFKSIYHFMLNFHPSNECLPTLVTTSTNLSNAAKNPYIETTLIVAFSYCQSVLGCEKFSKIFNENCKNDFVEITLKADNDFYSQLNYLKKNSLEVTIENLKGVPKYNACDVVYGEDGKVGVSKTGMGSSAALITSLSGAVVRFCGVACSDFPSVVHNLAQLSHCYAQGKVGSGFDVSSAAYGSHIYTRFSPDIISELISKTKERGGLPSPRDLFNCVQRTWDQTVAPILLPDNCYLLMADVCGGSDTPSMAKKVLAWRADENDNEGNLWERLIEANEEVVRKMLVLHQHHELDGGSELINDIGQMTSNQWDTLKIDCEGEEENMVSVVCELRGSFLTVRKLLKEIGEQAGVPIEPESQSKLADLTMKLPGVLVCGVPGAGGYDALFAIVLGEEAREGVLGFWEKCDGVCPLLGTSSATGLEY